MSVLTKQFVKRHIEIELGGTSIKVDLGDDDYEHIIEEALLALGTYFPTEHYGVFHASAGIQKYQFDAGTWGKGVIDVQRPYPTTPLYRAWPLPDPYLISIPLHYLGDYTLSLVHIKEGEYLFGASFHWKFDKNTGILMITPPPLEGGNWVYVYVDNPKLEQVHGRRKWLLDYAVARAKMIQGSKWRKFRNFPGTEQQVELYTEIYDEGKEEKEALEESLASAGSAAVPPRPSYRTG